MILYKFYQDYGHQEYVRLAHLVQVIKAVQVKSSNGFVLCRDALAACPPSYQRNTGEVWGSVRTRHRDVANPNRNKKSKYRAGKYFEWVRQVGPNQD